VSRPSSSPGGPTRQRSLPAVEDRGAVRLQGGARQVPQLAERWSARAPAGPFARVAGARTPRRRGPRHQPPSTTAWRWVEDRRGERGPLDGAATASPALRVSTVTRASVRRSRCVVSMVAVTAPVSGSRSGLEVLQPRHAQVDRADRHAGAWARVSPALRVGALPVGAVDRTRTAPSAERSTPRASSRGEPSRVPRALIRRRARRQALASRCAVSDRVACRRSDLAVEVGGHGQVVDRAGDTVPRPEARRSRSGEGGQVRKGHPPAQIDRVRCDAPSAESLTVLPLNCRRGERDVRPRRAAERPSLAASRPRRASGVAPPVMLTVPPRPGVASRPTVARSSSAVVPCTSTPPRRPTAPAPGRSG